MKTIYLLRHGALQGDSTHCFVGQIDLPLSHEGIVQAEAQASALRGRGVSMVHCSDLIRCQTTASILARALYAPMCKHSALREVSLGAWEGLSRREVARHWTEEFEARGRNIEHYRPPEGESFADCLARALPIWNAVLASDHKVVAIVGHAGLNRLLLSHIQGRAVSELFQIQQDYGCINVLEYSGGQYRVRLTNASPESLTEYATE